MSRFMPITDPERIAEIMAGGKWKEGIPLWILVKDTLWVEVATLGKSAVTEVEQ